MDILLIIHISAGAIALVCAALAASSEKGKKLHVLSGRTYFWSMVGIFLTAIPMSIINSNIFLFLIAIFSFYLAFAGMRFAKNRTGIATALDWVALSRLHSSITSTKTASAKASSAATYRYRLSTPTK